MSLDSPQDRLQLPGSLRSQLQQYRRRVWWVKMLEAVSSAVFGIMVAFLAMYAVDRAWETPDWVRLVLFLACWATGAMVPLALYRWVWRNRLPEQLARLLARTHPGLGDQLLGVIELVRSDSEQARSRALCEAAIQQVAEESSRRDFRSAVPRPRHRLWGTLAAVPVVAVAALFLVTPAATRNAWARLLAPWRSIPRYTFASVRPLPDRLYVAHGEPFSVSVKLDQATAWKPAQGAVRLGEQQPLTSPLREDGYDFEIPAQIDPGKMEVRVGDAVQRVRVEPTVRPELTSVIADVSLPSYLGRSKPLRRDVRGGVIALVKGSEARFVATASRELSRAEINGQAARTEGASVKTPPIPVDGTRSVEFRWLDQYGLSGTTPFVLSVNGRDDEAPTLTCENMPRSRVVLDTELLNFKVKAQDDFGIKRVGMEWKGVDDPTVKAPARGERLLAAGGNDKEAMELAGNFSAKSLGIEPQPVTVRIFAEDYLPGRARVYSPPYLLYVLNAEQHAIWLTEQLSKWHRQSLEVRDRELQLHETNKQLRALPSDELDTPETRRRIENQALAERANGRRLTSLVGAGEDLVQQAMRNPEFGVGHLEKWAEMLQILKDISANRMPSVADLLKQASQAPKVAGKSDARRDPAAGMIRDTRSKPDGSPSDAPKSASGVPQVVDRESSQQPLDEKAGNQPPPPASSGSPRLTLPTTTLAGNAPPGNQAPPPAAQKVDEAVVKQRDLLAEFEKIADELNRVLANLEGSTLVKRLKAASRAQYKIAGRVGDLVDQAFGVNGTQANPAHVKVIDELSGHEAKGSHDVSVIMDDMQSYFERRRFMQFKTVLDEMRKLDVVAGLRTLGDDLKKENGLSMAQCEFWSDTLDRWADDLVDPVSGGT